MTGNASTPTARTKLTAAQQELLARRLRGTTGAASAAPAFLHRAPDGPMPLSFAQQSLWILDRLQPNSALYNISNTIQLHGTLNAPALEQALNEIIRRHEILRTTFRSEGGLPVQIVGPAWRLMLAQRDLGSLQKPERDETLARLTEEEGQRPFDLESGPLLRASLFRLGPAEHLLLLTLHHIVFDTWSEGLFVAELTAHYEASLRGASAGLPDLPFQYSDFACWHRQWADSDECARQLAHWKQRLAGMPESLILPKHRPRPATQSARGACKSLQLPVALCQALRAVSRRENATMFNLLLAAFKVLLLRYTGQSDLVVGVNAASRPRVELASLIGYFVNMLVLRTDASGNPTFPEFLRRVHDTVMDAMQHPDLPFEKLVEGLQPKRTSGQNPLFQVAFVHQDLRDKARELPGLTLSLAPVMTGTAKFELTLFTEESAEGLGLTLEYSTDRFDAATMDRMLGHYGELLRGIAATPDCRIEELPLVPEEERQALIRNGTQTRTDYPRSRCIHQLFEAQAARSPEAVALESGRARLSYQEVNQRANRLAARLRQLGVGPDTLVALCAERSPEMIVALLAILKAGGAYVPLDPAYPRERLALMLANARSPVLLAHRRLAGHLPPHTAETVYLDDSLLDLPAENLPCNVSPENLAYVIYTSGSTGTPKGTAIPHRGVVRLVRDTNYADLGPDQVFLQCAPVSFDASTFEIWAPLLNGGRLALLPPGAASLEELGRAIRAHGITTLWLTSGLFQAMVDERLADLRGLRQLLAGGDVLSVPHVRRALEGLPGCRLINGYGPTESTTFATCHTITAGDLTGGSIPIGKPISNTTVYILDAHRQLVPVGVAGELHIGGDGLAREYLNQPELTREKFISDPFTAEAGARLYRTGDLCNWRADGTIEFHGRADQQVKIRGFRIELEDIETVLSQHPAVRAVAVTARADTTGDKRLVAYVVVRTDPAPDSAVLREHLRARLPDYMIPSAFVSLAALPLDPNGKVDRAALPAPVLSREPAARPYTAPSTPTEQSLALVWAEVLDLPKVGVHDDFFVELGGHSLLATRMLAKINQTFNTRLLLPALFAAPTIAQLARLLDGMEETQHTPSLVPLQPRGIRLPLFWVHTIGEDNGGLFLYRRIIQHLDADQPSYGIEAPVQPFHDLEGAAAGYLERLKTIQPQGPYYLAGYCFGGHVAFEMARQLEQRGEPVGLLLLIETSAQLAHQPYPWRWRTPLDIAAHQYRWTVDLLRRGPLDLGRRLVWRARTLPEQLKSSGNEADAWAQELDNTFNFAMHPPSFRAYAHAHWEALRKYRPGEYGGPAALLRIRKHGLTEFDPYLRWREICRGSFTMHIIPGDHVSIFDEPHVQTLAQRCQQCLDAAREANSNPGRPG